MFHKQRYDDARQKQTTSKDKQTCSYYNEERPGINRQTDQPGKEHENSHGRRTTHVSKKASTQASKRANKQESKQTSKQAGKEASKQAGCQAGRQADRVANRQARAQARAMDKQVSKQASKRSKHTARQDLTRPLPTRRHDCWGAPHPRRGPSGKPLAQRLAPSHSCSSDPSAPIILLTRSLLSSSVLATRRIHALYPPLWRSVEILCQNLAAVSDSETFRLSATSWLLQRCTQYPLRLARHSSQALKNHRLKHDAPFRASSFNPGL